MDLVSELAIISSLVSHECANSKRTVSAVCFIELLYIARVHYQCVSCLHTPFITVNCEKTAVL